MHREPTPAPTMPVLSTLAALARRSGGDAAVIGDANVLAARLARPATAGEIVLATAGADRIPGDWIVFCPADVREAEKVAALATHMRRPVLVGVSETPVPEATAPSDVVDPGWPNVYATGDEIAIITTGPVLHLAIEAARQMAESGVSASVLHLPAIAPIRRAALAEAVGCAPAAVWVAGHPLGAALGPVLAAHLHGVRIVAAAEPTIPAMIAAAAEALGFGDGKTNNDGGKRTMGRPRFAERMGRLGTENAFEVLAVVNRLKAEGRDIISFAIGEPDFPSPSNVKRAGIRAIEEDKTHYGESQGLAELRRAAADYMRRTRGIEVGPENVVVTPGAKPIMFNTLAATVDPGDEVIYPNPGFPIYESLIDFIGATPVPVPLREELGFNFDPDEFRRLVTPKTRLAILNTPQNPTGGVLTADSLRVVADLARERGFWVLSDEIYSQMVYDGAFASIAALPGMLERTVILDGFSKTFAMTGWRIGFGVMPADLARHEARIETNLNSCTATFTQWAGVEALTGDQSESRAMIAEFGRRRKLIVDGLNAIPGFSCAMPGGAFYAYPNVTEACRMAGVSCSKEFQEKLLHEAGVAVLPRTAFGRKPAGEQGEYVRFSYASAATLIEQGLARIRTFMEKRG